MKQKEVSIHVEINQRPNKKTGLYALFLRTTITGQKPEREKLPDQIRLSDWNVKMEKGKPVLTKAGNTINIGTLEKKNWVKNTCRKNELINEYIYNRILILQKQFETIKKENTGAISLKPVEFTDFFWAHVQSIAVDATRINMEGIYDYFLKFLAESSFSENVIPDFCAFLKKYRKNNGEGEPLKSSSIKVILGGVKAVLALYKEKYNFTYATPKLTFATDPEKRKKKISYEDIQELMATQKDRYKFKKKWNAIHTFLLCFFSRGMRIRDAIFLKWENVTEETIIYVPSKTKRFGKQIEIPITVPMREILNRFKMYQKEGYPYISLCQEFYPIKEGETQEEHIQRIIANINGFLKCVAKQQKWNISFSTHSARHSFINHIYRSTGDVYKASRAAGHSTIRMTERYVEDLSAAEVKETMTELFG